MKEKIETKQTEVRIVTRDAKEMLHKFTAGRVLKQYTEDFVDKDTVEAVSIERNEVLFDRGTLIDHDTLSEIQFYLQAGEITEVEVSNQRRAAYHVENTYLRPFIAQVMIEDKKQKMLFYSPSVEASIPLLKDYVELNYSGRFAILSISGFSTDLVLEDNLVAPGEEGRDDIDEPKDKKFYQIKFKVDIDDAASEYIQTAVVHTESVDRAMMLIGDWLQKNERRRVERARKEGLKDTERTLIPVIEEAKPVTVKDFIPREFSEAYAED